MIYLKIYVTLCFVLILIGFFSFLLMDSDIKREDLWWKITQISLIGLLIISFVGALSLIWVFN